MLIPEHLLPNRFPLAQTEHTTRCIKVKPGTTIEMVLDPDFWVHNSGMIKAYDKVEIIAVDGSFEVEVRCIAVDVRGYWAQMRLLNWWPRDLPVLAKWVHRGKQEPAPKTWPDAEGYRIEWAGPAHRWRIIDRAGQIVDKGFSAEAEAAEMLDRVKQEKAEIPRPAAQAPEPPRRGPGRPPKAAEAVPAPPDPEPAPAEAEAA